MIASRRNVAIIGHPDSGANELIDSMMRLSDNEPIVVTLNDGLTEVEYKPPYNAKQRKKLSVFSKENKHDS